MICLTCAIVVSGLKRIEVESVSSDGHLIESRMSAELELCCIASMKWLPVVPEGAATLGVPGTPGGGGGGGGWCCARAFWAGFTWRR